MNPNFQALHGITQMIWVPITMTISFHIRVLVVRRFYIFFYILHSIKLRLVIFDIYLFIIGAIAVKFKPLDSLHAEPYIKSKFVTKTYSDRY
jgi:hypothetical protein